MKEGPTISPDGRFWWDGTHWQPMQQRGDYNLGQRPGNAFSQSFMATLGNKMAGCGGCLVVIILFFVIMGVLGSLGHSG